MHGEETKYSALGFGQKFKARLPDQSYMFVDNEYFNALVSKCQFNIETELFEFEDDMAMSSYIIGSAVDSMCEYR